jgi:hypothetical protein
MVDAEVELEDAALLFEDAIDGKEDIDVEVEAFNNI